MIKKIPIGQLKPGMFVVSHGAGTFSDPHVDVGATMNTWTEIFALKRSGATEVTVDTAREITPPARKPATGTAPKAAPARPAAPRPAAARPAPARPAPGTPPQPSFTSMPLRRAPRISEKEFTELHDFIYDLTGIDIPARRKYLVENRLGARLKELGLKTYAEYAAHLRSSPDRAKEFNLLFEKITTNETSFFRDVKQLDAFKEHILAEVIREKEKAGSKELNIWSAGCSSGEEPYTLGIILHELLRIGIIGWKITITANDLSPAMVAKARRGVYNDYALRTTSPEMLKTYFTTTPGGYQIHPKVQKLVKLGLINLNDSSAVKRVPTSDIIFCRNVIIYFDDAMKKKVIQGFYDNLRPGGYLVLGHSESIHSLGTKFKTSYKPGAVFHHKKG